MPNTREKLIERLPVDDAILILREELKQRVDGYATHLSYGGKGDPAEEVSLDALEMAIEALEKQKWISVKDRTPTEADGTVWICLADVFPYNEKEPYIDAKHDGRITEAFYSHFSKRWYKDGAVFPDGVVTHWMEKAQPPKGE